MMRKLKPLLSGTRSAEARVTGREKYGRARLLPSRLAEDDPRLGRSLALPVYIAGRIELAFAILTFIFITIACPATAHAIVLSDHDESHVVTPGEPMYGVNLDGVVALGNGEPRSATFAEITVFECTGALISDRHVLTAAHCLDKDRDGRVDLTVRGFPYVAGFQLPDGERLIELNTSAVHFPSSWPLAGIEIGGNFVGGADMAVLELMEDAPPAAPRYTLYGGRDELGAPIVLTGYGTTGFGDTGIGELATVATVKRAGLNRLEAYLDDLELELGVDFDSGQSEHNTLSVLGHDSDLGFGADEVLTAAGDSGAPVFWNESIVGVVSFNTSLIATDFNDTFDQSWGEAAYAMRVSSFRDFLTEATGGQAIFVPEPNLTCHLVWILLLISRAIRRKIIFWRFLACVR